MIKNTHILQYEKGSALLIFVLFFMFITGALTYSLSRIVYAELQTQRTQLAAKGHTLASEALVEDMAYRYVSGMNVEASESLTLNGHTAQAGSYLDAGAGQLVITATTTSSLSMRASEIVLSTGSGAAFNYGIQTGNGGFLISNSAQVVGNVFANGTIEAASGGTADHIIGDVISAGPAGLIDRIRVTGSAWADRIQNSNIKGNAHFTTISGTSVTGTPYPGSPNQAPEPMPISDETIDEWKQNIVDTGVVIASSSSQCSGGTYTINSNATLGNVKIECNLVVRQNSTTLTLDGNIWVEGNINFSQNPTVKIDSALGPNSVYMIADNPDDRLTSSIINIANSTKFDGSGHANSFVLLISQNSSAESGGSQDAISIEQSSNGDLLLYAAHGKITLANNISLKEITAYRIEAGNSTTITYASGLANLLFTSGPGGGYRFLRQREIE